MFFLLAGLYGWAVFELPLTVLLVCRLRHFCFQVLQVCSELPTCWISTPRRVIYLRKRKTGTFHRSSHSLLLFLVGCRWSEHGRSSRNDCLTGNRSRDGWQKRSGKGARQEGYGMDWETRRLTELSDEELLEIAVAEARGWIRRTQTKQDLEVIAILSAVNTAVTVMVLGFLTSSDVHALVQH